MAAQCLLLEEAGRKQCVRFRWQYVLRATIFEFWQMSIPKIFMTLKCDKFQFLNV